MMKMISIINLMNTENIAMLNDLKHQLNKLADPERAKLSRRYFKTGKGDYGEGDEFIGIKVPQQRVVARQFRDMNLDDLQKLLNSRIHEYRLTALLIIVGQYERHRRKGEIESALGLVNFYLANLKQVNNWDLVDLSAPKILGDFILNHKNYQRLTSGIDVDLIYGLAKSKNIWKRRVAVLATFPFIQAGQFDDALKIARLLIPDKQDLIHKATGWMLREIGKRDKKTLVSFLDKYHARMPRTMLRYAVEKFETKDKSKYLQKLIIKK